MFSSFRLKFNQERLTAKTNCWLVFALREHFGLEFGRPFSFLWCVSGLPSWCEALSLKFPKYDPPGKTGLPRVRIRQTRISSHLPSIHIQFDAKLNYRKFKHIIKIRMELDIDKNHLQDALNTSPGNVNFWSFLRIQRPPEMYFGPFRRAAAQKKILSSAFASRSALFFCLLR